MTWPTYEEIVKNIYEQLGKQSNVTIICFGNNCKVTGKSGVAHQVDVLTSHSDGLHDYKTAIECKYWEEKVSKDPIMKLSNILEDAHIDKGVVVSKNGFTPDAISFAKYKNIDLIELREPNDKDWEGRLQNFIIHSSIYEPQINNFEIIIPNNSIFDEQTNKIFDYELYQILIHTDDKVFTLENIIYQEIQKIKNKKQSQDIVIHYSQKTVLEVADASIKILIESLQFTVTHKVLTKEIKVDVKDKVSMMMKALFSNREFIIDNFGKTK